MNLFAPLGRRPSWTLSRRGRKPGTRRRPPPGIEFLEARATPAVLQVVGGGGNGTTTFNTFAQAYAASTAAGDVIQIEPQAGDVGSISLTSSGKALTVQGDPNFAYSATAEVVNDVTLSVNNTRLQHLQFTGTVGPSIGTTGVFITDTRLGSFYESSGNGNNTLVRNDIAGVMDLAGSTGDQILDNNFTNLDIVRGTIATLSIQAATNVQVQGNTFLGLLTSIEPESSIEVYSSHNITIADNQIIGTDAIPGVSVSGSPTYPVTGLVFTHNDIRTQGGDGVVFEPDTESLQAVFQNNAFQGDGTAIAVNGGTDLSPGSYIDAGGGAGGSLGMNEFRVGMTTAISISDAAITANHLTVSAGANVVGQGVKPVNIVFGTVAVNAGTSLTADQGFIAALYHDLLEHTPTLGELNGWVAALAGAGRQGVAGALLRSEEGADRLVQQLYGRILGRDAGQAERAGFVSQLTGGGTEEQVVQAMLASPEFAARANALEGTVGSSPDQNFVLALYGLLLGRSNESTAEVNAWVQGLPTQGRAVVAAAFLGSLELRNDYVQGLYTDYVTLPLDTFIGTVDDLLYREGAPSSAETSPWASSRLDMLSIAQTLASSGEFYADG